MVPPNPYFCYTDSMGEFTAAAFCAVGAEKVVSNELKKLSLRTPAAGGHTAGEYTAGASTYTVLESGFGKVRFKTDLAGLYRALMSLRAADRLLLEADAFPAVDFDALFEGTRSISWESIIPRGMGLVVGKVRSSRSQLKAETSVQAVVHKAAAERLCTHYGLRRLPEGVPQAELRVYLEKDQAQVLVDLCGEPLFKRGYRPAGGIAPLRESTAAAIILLSGWRRKFPLYDPFCGSGTILVEAALYAWDFAPGLGRRFTLSALLIGDKQTEETIRRELAEKVDYTRHICIRGSDADEKAAALARANLRRAVSGSPALPGKPSPEFQGGTIPGVEISRLSLEEMPTLTSGASMPEGFIVTNPPYGRRLGDPAEAEERYRNMAVLCKIFPGWKLALICDHPGFESCFGKKADSCRELKSGAIDTWLYQYEKL
jgi:putative N6-adenine-specific DNA methylase